MGRFRTKEDQAMRISKSIFVTNFPDSFGPCDLWNLCQVYGKVVDVFVPNRKSKAGKRYAFVRFIKVDDMDRLIGNLCTLWVGRFHLHANAVRYERPSKPTPSVNNPSSHTQKHNVSDATALKNTKSFNRSSKEGFGEIKLSYLGGLWVMIELSNEETIIELLQHTGCNTSSETGQTSHLWHQNKMQAEDFIYENGSTKFLNKTKELLGL
nr:RNA-directed DNA polymerase, eukaryota, nucleotide-binding alpha-beta plait domain protein [Tanacetum cinerariifolium]